MLHTTGHLPCCLQHVHAALYTSYYSPTCDSPICCLPLPPCWHGLPACLPSAWTAAPPTTRWCWAGARALGTTAIHIHTNGEPRRAAGPTPAAGRLPRARRHAAKPEHAALGARLPADARLCSTFLFSGRRCYAPRTRAVARIACLFACCLPVPLCSSSLAYAFHFSPVHARAPRPLIVHYVGLHAALPWLRKSTFSGANVYPLRGERNDELRAGAGFFYSPPYHLHSTPAACVFQRTFIARPTLHT